MAAMPLIDEREEVAQLASRFQTIVPTPPENKWRQAGILVAATVIRGSDRILSRLRARKDADTAEVQQLITTTEGLRQAAYLLMTQLNPDQAWFWTEEWQAGEREADADYIAGRTTTQASTEDFIAAMKARRPDLADS